MMMKVMRMTIMMVMTMTVATDKHLVSAKNGPLKILRLMSDYTDLILKCKCLE